MFYAVTQLEREKSLLSAILPNYFSVLSIKHKGLLFFKSKCCSSHLVISNCAAATLPITLYLSVFLDEVHFGPLEAEVTL